MARRSSARQARPRLTVHQIVAYNVARAREEKGWTQTQTGEYLEPFLGHRLNQGGVSALEKTFDGDRRRNIDVAEVVAFARCFGKPLAWFFIPPPGHGSDLVGDDEGPADQLDAAHLLGLAAGSPEGWQSYLGRVTELLETDADSTWEVLHQAFGGTGAASRERQLDLRRRALLQVTLARMAGPEDVAIRTMAALLVQLVKLTPEGNLRLRDTDPDEALSLLAEGDSLVAPLLESAQERRRDNRRAGVFDALEPLDVEAALSPDRKR